MAEQLSKHQVTNTLCSIKRRPTSGEAKLQVTARRVLLLLQVDATSQVFRPVRQRVHGQHGSVRKAGHDGCISQPQQAGPPLAYEAFQLVDGPKHEVSPFFYTSFITFHSPFHFTCDFPCSSLLQRCLPQDRVAFLQAGIGFASLALLGLFILRFLRTSPS